MPILAYLDPVTGSAIVQMLLGALAAAGLGWQYLRKGTNDFMARFRKEDVVEVDSKETVEAS